MVVLSVGGSIVAPDGVDVEFVTEFAALVADYVSSAWDDGLAMVLVVGGGGPARAWQRAYRAITGDAARPDAGDWIGIMATRLNAELVRHALAPDCQDPVVYDPTGPIEVTGKILVAAGWKPGWSTDYDAVLLAERYGADTVINLSNIAKVYTADPQTDPDARPLDAVTWEEFRAIVGDEWTPGKNVPFDPVATRKAAELGLRVVAAAGRDIANTRAILNGGQFEGTVIGP